MLKFAFSVLEATKASGAGRSKIYEEISEGRLPARKLGRRTLNSF